MSCRYTVHPTECIHPPFTPRTPIKQEIFRSSAPAALGGGSGSGGDNTSSAQDSLPHQHSARVDTANLLNVTGLLEYTLASNPSRINSIPLTINALAEVLGDRPGHASAITPGLVTAARHGRSASTAGDRKSGGSDGSLARTFGWIDSAMLSSAGDSSKAATGPSTAEGEALLTEAPASPFVPPDPYVLVRKKSNALLRVGDLGRDPREAAKLMSKNSFFVPVEGATVPPLPQSPSSGVPRVPLLGAVGRRHSGRTGDANTPVPTADDPENPSSEMPTNLPVKTREDSERVEVRVGAGAGAGARRDSNACSPGGFAFSCDPQAQRAEIAMILGERTGPMKHTTAFYEHRLSLRAQRIERARHTSSSLLPGAFLSEEEGEAGGGRGDAAPARGRGVPLQRRYSYTVCTEPSSSSSLPSVLAARAPAESNDGAGAGAAGGNGESEGGGGTRAISGGRFSHIVGNGTDVAGEQLQALQLIMEEKATDPEIALSSINHRSRSSVDINKERSFGSTRDEHDPGCL